MNNISLKKVSSAFRVNYQKYQYKSLDKSLKCVKGAILNTLINVSNKFNRFKAAIVLTADLNTIKSESIEIVYGKIDKYDIDMMIIDIWDKYEQELSHIKMYIYSVYLIINTCCLY